MGESARRILTSRRVIPLTVVLLALCFGGAASAGLGDERALAEQYAPVVRLVTQAEVG